MEDVFQNQILGMMELASRMMGMGGLDGFMDEDESVYAQQNPFSNDTAPIPQRSRQQSTSQMGSMGSIGSMGSMDPSFVAPHSYHFYLLTSRNRKTPGNPSSRTSSRHHLLFISYRCTTSF